MAWLKKDCLFPHRSRQFLGGFILLKIVVWGRLRLVDSLKLVLSNIFRAKWECIRAEFYKKCSGDYFTTTISVDNSQENFVD
jgi:hypothetical protein